MTKKRGHKTSVTRETSGGHTVSYQNEKPPIVTRERTTSRHGRGLKLSHVKVTDVTTGLKREQKSDNRQLWRVKRDEGT